jgi:hypothetical protein
MEALGILGVLVALFALVVLAVLGILMPWFVYRIAKYQRLTYELLRADRVVNSEAEQMLAPPRGTTSWPEPR